MRERLMIPVTFDPQRGYVTVGDVVGKNRTAVRHEPRGACRAAGPRTAAEPQPRARTSLDSEPPAHDASARGEPDFLRRWSRSYHRLASCQRVAGPAYDMQKPCRAGEPDAALTLQLTTLTADERSSPTTGASTARCSTPTVSRSICRTPRWRGR